MVLSLRSDHRRIQRSIFKLIHRFGFNRRILDTRHQTLGTFHDRKFLIYLSSGVKLQRNVRRTAYCVFVRMCFVCIRVRLSFFVSFFATTALLCQCLCQCGLSEMYTLFTTYSRIIIFVLPDRLTFALITIILFLFSDWMSPFDRVVCGEYPYHCYIGAAVSLKNIGQKFFLHSENRY